MILTSMPIVCHCNRQFHVLETKTTAQCPSCGQRYERDPQNPTPKNNLWIKIKPTEITNK
jgi:DNA-directed RNA polymerase subunit RPC12/RpoP